jgi:Uma2 family endonuclease
MAKPPGSDRLVTADELLNTSIPDKQVELVRGAVIVRELPGFRHGRISVDIAARLREHVRARKLGIVVAETGFKLFADPDTVRGPDAAFIARDRVPNPEPVGYLALAPDLVVEVLSPGDRAGEVQSKVSDWLSAGSRLVWVIDPARRRGVVYRADTSVELLGENDALDGEDVLPGFSCVLAEIL